MATGFKGQRVFVDTNILYYANNPSDPFGTQALARMKDLLSDGNNLIISGQILREYAHASIRDARKSGKGIAEATADALHNIQIFKRDFLVLHDDEAVLDVWIELLPMLLTQKDVFDCNLVAIMQVNDIRHILTHNVSDFSRFPGIVVIPMFS